jgi:hypothetical protein
MAFVTFSPLPSAVAREKQDVIIVAIMALPGPLAFALILGMVARTTYFVPNLFLDKTAGVVADSIGVEPAWWPRGVLEGTYSSIQDGVGGIDTGEKVE